MTEQKLLELITPGEILKDEFMTPMGLSANQLARDLDVPVNRITEIINGRRSISADTALRLGRYFEMEPQFWLNLQANYDLKLAKRLKGKDIESSVHPRISASH